MIDLKALNMSIKYLFSGVVYTCVFVNRYEYRIYLEKRFNRFKSDGDIVSYFIERGKSVKFMRLRRAKLIYDFYKERSVNE